MEDETREDRRRRLKREARARWRARNPERDREASARWLEENRERNREASRRWHAENRAASLLRACRSSAKRRGHECSLTLEDVLALVRPMACSITGVPLSWEWEGPGRNPWAPSIDRIDCGDGYHLDNVRPVCWAYNVARSEWPDDTVRRWAEALTRRPH